MNGSQLLSGIGTPEFDYPVLKDQAKDYRYPRNKIGSLIKRGEIFRIKKGIYVKNKTPFSKLILANMIYGPSYVSEDTALSHFGLIPEKVETTTSMSIGRKKVFQTPVGVFTYNVCRREMYPLGVTRVMVDERRGFLLACPEKALWDRLLGAKEVEKIRELKIYLFENMRMDPDAVGALNWRTLSSWHKRHPQPFSGALLKILKDLK